MPEQTRVAILGAGNMGQAIATGLTQAGGFSADQITLTRKRTYLLDHFSQQGFIIQADNCSAVRQAEVIIMTVDPHQIESLLKEIGPDLRPGKHLLISVVAGVTIQQIADLIDHQVAIVRAMPNTAIAVGESMTCLAAQQRGSEALQQAEAIFATVGKTLLIDEAQMGAATVLGASGVAFFLRAIRAATQGGLEIGFQPDEALTIVAQVAKGAATLVNGPDHHPEAEIDKVTTPGGCTISGLNEMAQAGFSAAMIRGIITAADKVH